MRQVMANFLAASFLACTSSPAFANAMRDCPPLATDPIGMKVEEVVTQSSAIVLAVAQDFDSPEDLPSNLGFYEFDVGRTLKGDIAAGPLKVFGFEPYAYVPQHYIDATLAHEKGGNQYRSTELNKVKVGDACHLAFKGVESYSYLLFFRNGKLWGFNVINNRHLDELLRQVEALQQ